MKAHACKSKLTFIMCVHFAAICFCVLPGRHSGSLSKHNHADPYSFSSFSSFVMSLYDHNTFVLILFGVLPALGVVVEVLFFADLVAVAAVVAVTAVAAAVLPLVVALALTVGRTPEVSSFWPRPRPERRISFLSHHSLYLTAVNSMVSSVPCFINTKLRKFEFAVLPTSSRRLLCLPCNSTSPLQLKNQEITHR